MKGQTRKEKDVLGEVKVPINAYWGVNTQRAIQNFQISGKTFPKSFILALVKVKKACLRANLELGEIDKEKSDALLQVINEILVEEKHLDHFPLDVYQTGSGTQINMNANEVLANRANEILGHELGKKFPVHPNDHVNKGQSSNDVVPTSMHLSTLDLLHAKLFPAIDTMRQSLKRKIEEFEGIVKVGRTHLQDAVPIPLSTELSVYLRQLNVNQMRLNDACEELYSIPIGGTALGTGISAHKDFGELASSHLKAISGFPFRTNPVKAEGIASHSPIVKTSGVLRLLALSCLKMANDIRWMGSGPRAGLSELLLPANEPGSSIMPGKINPTQSEALIQVCLQVIGNDTAISYAEGYGSILDLNVTKPLMIVNLLESIQFLAGAINSFVKNCLEGLQVNIAQIKTHLERILMIVTNLIPQIGYDKASEIAQIAYKTNKTIKEVVIEMGLEIKGDLDELLDPRKMV
jgi:fumarate hydratase class II